MFCWAFAKRMGGSFVLRIEDTDAARSSEASAKGIMEDLAWLGIHWDQGPTLDWQGKKIGGDPFSVGPFFQAQRVKSHYTPAVMKLVEQGKAYPAIEDDATLEAEKKAAAAAKKNYRYNRASYTKIPDIKDRIKLIERGEPHVIRFFSPAEEIAFTDEVLGPVRIAPGEVDDFIICRADGFPMYNFAVVVDDHAMGITHVLRAQEHLSNTPRQIALYRAFGFAPPAFAHMPLIFNTDGSKMSKRDKAKLARKTLADSLAKNNTKQADFAHKLGLEESELAAFLKADNDSLDTAQRIAKQLRIALPEIDVSDFREAGYSPDAINNFLALLGWNPGMKLPDGKDLERFDLAFLREHFSIDRIGKTNGKFDRKKLLAFNGDVLSQLSDEQYASQWRTWAKEFDTLLASHLSAIDATRMQMLLGAVKPRAKTFRDASAAASFVFARPQGYDGASVEKNLLANEKQGLGLLKQFRGALAALPTFDPSTVHGAIEQIVATAGLPNPGALAQAVRVAITGSGVSPSLDVSLALLGQQESLARIDACLQAHGA
jgi:glutamyl-tRNA synthetase